MMKRINTIKDLMLWAFMGLALIATFQAKAESPRRIVYTGDPITIVLSVGAEQRITFPDTKIVNARIKEKLTKSGKLTNLIINNNVHWTANEAFKKERFIIGEEGGTKVYLLDVSAVTTKVSNRRILVVDGEDNYAVSDKDKDVKPETVIKPLQRKSTPSAGFVTLFRCAAKQVYAPMRLVKCPVGIHAEFVNKRPIKHLMRYASTTTQPMATWRSAGVYITAIKVTNTTHEKLSMDPRLLRGHWKAAFFMHPRLSPAGYKRDNTTLFLISKKPFADAIASDVMITVDRR